MNPLDDFFAFHEDETIVKPEKKKKKKKRPKTASPNVPSSSKFDKSDTSMIHEPPSLSSTDKSVSTEPVITEQQHKKKSVSAEAMLAGLLGLSEPSEIKPTGKAITPEQTVDFVDTDEVVVVEDTVKKEDDFLKEMNSYISSAAQQDQLAVELLQLKQDEKFLIDGVELEGKAVKFEFHVVIEAAGQISGAYDLQVKGSTKVSKLIHTLMSLFNQTADPAFPESEYKNLVLYVKSLNVILRPELRIMSLLSYKNLLEKSVTVTGYEVDAMITTEEYAMVLYNAQESLKNSSVDTQDRAEDDPFVVSLEDARLKRNYNLEVMPTMKLTEVIEMYKYRLKLPTKLLVTVSSGGDVLDEKETLKTLGIYKGQSLLVEYDEDLLKQLLEEGDYVGDADEADDADDLVELDERRTVEDSTDCGEKYFTVYMAGKDKKRYKVDVKPSTMIAELAAFYKQKAELPPDTKITLSFDDEDLDMSGTVADTELEEDYMIDVIY